MREIVYRDAYAFGGMEAVRNCEINCIVKIYCIVKISYSNCYLSIIHLGNFAQIPDH